MCKYGICMCVCVCVCMDVRMYVYTCYVLTSPPIPSSRCKHFVGLRPNIFLLHKRADPRVPHCNDLENLFV